MATEIKTSIIINALPDQVWKVLTNFDEYKNWNPFIKTVTGNVAVNNKIRVEFDAMTFKPKVLKYNTNQEFEWLGHLFFPGLFDGKHSFTLIDNEDGTTTLFQQEIFKGILVPLFKKKLLVETKLDFENMNKKLKEQVEK